METWLVIYDIRNEKRLRRIAKMVERYGVRVQKSVFEAMCNETTIQRMRSEAKTILEKEDSLIIIPLCASCWQKKKQYGVTTEGIGEYKQFYVL
ncbi:MAG: CRISPR-associated endonuclease Cas2 [Spirochaetes bacterium]|nr:CRISPR-associated endonuclease Cas2 [Spirochaetota bacterium]